MVKNRAKNRVGQVSVEYTLIIGFIVVALTISVGVAFTYASSAQYQIKLNQIDKIGKKIAETADSIYYLGQPSKSTIDLNMPDGVREIIIDREKSPNYIKFRSKGPNGDAFAVYYVRGLIYNNGQPLNDTRFTRAGLKRLVVNMTDNYVMLTPLWV